jgi:hypothetical protein
MLSFLPFCRRHSLILFLLAILLILLPDNISGGALAWTYDTIWWLGHSPTATEEQSSGYVHIYYTYPTIIQAGEEFDIGVTLEYIKNEAVVTNWLLFNNVSIALRNYNHSDDEVLDISIDRHSHLVRPGESYSNSFTLKAPESPGKYLVFPHRVAWFGPGTTVLENFDWNMESYYNQTQREFGVIYPEEMPAINVTEQQDNKNMRKLSLELDEPYNQIDPPNIIISNKTLKTNSILTENGLSFSLPFGSFYDVTIPNIIEMQPDKIRAIFSGWADGGEYKKVESANEISDNITRSVLMDSNKALFALYKTQYSLDVTSQGNTGNPNGTDWYESGAQAHYSINPLGGFFNFPFPKSFDRWIGDVPSETDNIASGHLTMDGPKKLQALWKTDYTFLGIWIGGAGSMVGILEFVRKVRASHKPQPSTKY